jgi:hypothetical protein
MQQKGWLRLQDNKVENWEQFQTEWKARGLPYPWRHIDLKNERKATEDRIRVGEGKDYSRQLMIAIAISILSFTIMILSYLFL